LRLDAVYRNVVNSGIVVLLLLVIGTVTVVVATRQDGPMIAVKSLTASTWWQADWKKIPVYRKDGADPLTIQLWGNIETLQAQLLHDGWHAATPLALTNAVMWLSPSLNIEQLPLWEKSLMGRRESLLLVKPLDSAVQGRHRKQMVLRIWPAFQGNKQQQTPLWLGTVVIMNIKETIGEFFYPRVSKNLNQPMDELRRVFHELPGENFIKTVNRSEKDYTYRWQGQVLLIKLP
jgi:hypothetical protein